MPADRLPLLPCAHLTRQVETHTLWFATKKTILDVREMRLDPNYRASHKWDSYPTEPGREPLCTRISTCMRMASAATHNTHARARF